MGDCGMFLGTRSEIDAQLWRAFYDYARLILKLGHFESFVDSDVKAALVHSSAEGACDGNSRVCLWWSEFDFDDEEYSCRPKQDASNVVTPAVLLATLAEPTCTTRRPPPPPEPPALPPSPSPSPGSVRCQLDSVPSTKYRKTVYVRPEAEGGGVHYVPLDRAGAGTSSRTGRRLWFTATYTRTWSAARPAGSRAARATCGGPAGSTSRN